MGVDRGDSRWEGANRRIRREGGQATHGGYIHGGGLGRIVSNCVVSLEHTLKEVSLGTHGGTLKERDRRDRPLVAGGCRHADRGCCYSKMAEKNEGDDLMGR